MGTSHAKCNKIVQRIVEANLNTMVASANLFLRPVSVYLHYLLGLTFQVKGDRLTDGGEHGELS